MGGPGRDQVIDLAPSGFLFAALAGLESGLILDDVNGRRDRTRLGWLLLGGGPPLAAGCLLLGLP